MAIRLIAWVISIPTRVRRGSGNRNRIKGELALNRALIALAADDAGGARREADRGRRLLGDTPLTLLIAAQAGRQAGREDEATALYEQLAERPDARLLGLRGLMRLAVEQEDWERATALAASAEQAHPNAAWLRDERRYMAQATGEWREALRLATPENKAALAVLAAQNETDPKAALALAKQAFDAEPSLAPRRNRLCHRPARRRQAEAGAGCTAASLVDPPEPRSRDPHSWPMPATRWRRHVRWPC